MKPVIMGLLIACGATATVAAGADPATAPELTTTQVIEKNLAARGSAAAWRKIQTMVWTGHIESENEAIPKMPFVLEMKKPNKTHFEVSGKTQAALRIYDGNQGWKVHPTANGKLDVQSFNDAELRFAHDAQGLDGPLVDYASKGTTVSLEGVDEIEGRRAYRLNVKMPSGESQFLWVDAENFLDLKYARQVRNTAGRAVTLAMYYQNYQTVDDLQIPFTIESGNDTIKAANRMVVEKVLLNPTLAETEFSKPNVSGQHHGVTIDTRSTESSSRPAKWPAATMAPDGAQRTSLLPAPASRAEP